MPTTQTLKECASIKFGWPNKSVKCPWDSHDVRLMVTCTRIRTKKHLQAFNEIFLLLSSMIVPISNPIFLENRKKTLLLFLPLDVNRSIILA